ncbi:hypothetical protein OROMI_031867 [Orobanche minor]
MSSSSKSSKGDETYCEGEILVGSWGGPGGTPWSYKANDDGIKQIIIRSGGVIDSIIFKGDGDETSAEVYSVKFGGRGGNRTEKILIDFPSEYLTGISGSHGRWGHFPDLVTSLKLHTNRTEYGPFGKGSGTRFSFVAHGGVITGFHGRAGAYLDAIGVYIKPACPLFKVVANRKQHHPLPEISVRDLGLLTRSPGPFPCCVSGGRAWDDGVFAAVKAVQVHVCSKMGVVSGVRFLYEKRNGNCVWSSMHGAPAAEDMVEKVETNGINEFLIGVEGFHGLMDGMDVIRSLTFHTNKGKYGPMGYEFGEYFCTMSLSLSVTGKVVGFRGKTGAYLSMIDVHSEYF